MSRAAAPLPPVPRPLHGSSLALGGCDGLSCPSRSPCVLRRPDDVGPEQMLVLYSVYNASLLAWSMWLYGKPMTNALQVRHRPPPDVGFAAPGARARPFPRATWSAGGGVCAPCPVALVARQVEEPPIAEALWLWRSLCSRHMSKRWISRRSPCTSVYCI